MTVEERVQKILSAYGICSRREAERLMTAGEVLVNGTPAALGDRADPERDRITVRGVPLRAKAPEHCYVMLHKPRGYVTTLSDEKGRANVAELVSGCGVRVYPVGRLDLNSEGLLLLTNDGELANALMHPKKQVDKTYLVWVSSYIAGSERSLAQPIGIDGRMTSPAEVQLIKADGPVALLRITIHEGRNRQIRRLCERAGLTVTRLRRIQEGPLQLGELKPGQSRPLTQTELERLFEEIQK